MRRYLWSNTRFIDDTQVHAGTDEAFALRIHVVADASNFIGAVAARDAPAEHARGPLSQLRGHETAHGAHVHPAAGQVAQGQAIEQVLQHGRQCQHVGESMASRPRVREIQHGRAHAQARDAPYVDGVHHERPRHQQA